MTARFLEVYPYEIFIEQNGLSYSDRSSVSPIHAQLNVTWVRPNETQCLVEGVLNKFELVPNYVKNNFDSDEHYGGQNLINTQLLKLRAMGQSVIKVELFASEQRQMLNSLLYNVYSREFTPMADAFETMLDIVDCNLDKQQQLKNIQQNVRSLGVGYALYNAKTHYEGVFEFDLRLAKDLYAFAGTGDDSVPLKSKGESNGHVKLKLKLLL